MEESVFDKFGLLDRAILLLNQAADATGIQRCSLLVNTVQLLAALKDNLKDEEARQHEQAASE